MIQNKYVIRLSFIGLFLNIVANIILYRYFMIEEIIVKQVATENSRIAEIYQKHIWDMHPLAIKKFKKNSYQNLLQDQDFIDFVKDSIAFFRHINAQISLFDMYGNKFISNMQSDNIAHLKHNDSSIYGLILAKIDKYFLRDLMTNQTIESAFHGKTTHALWPETLIINKDKKSTSASFISSYIPIIDDDLSDFIVDSVMEIDTDVTEQWKNMSYLEQKVFTAFLIIFSIFFSIVTYNTNYAQRIINKQFEANRGLEEARIRAETESSAKTEFLANVSHELRTPLNAIIGFSEIIISETYGAIENKQYAEYVQDINNSGKHLLSIINDILDFSKASVDKLKVEHVELDLNKLASSSMRFVKPRADEAKIQLIEDLPKEHIVIKADPKRLKQALLNLLSNSVKFTPENGKITLKITIDASMSEVYIQVIDTGIGMSEKDIPKALSTFGQIDNKLSRKYEGTGLGLPLTKKLVELMHGKFDLTSIIGVGTTITLTFKYEDSITI
ncbi:sensor histidine kinase [Candidatus Trichorickettsia mobilis]|uniref:sensor histidine kinase n=1 Tax=Candidatus Trichorickettsia mobilis TaxID=1346319 RepID=UPI00292E17D8|nr:ATP-binding protein [Candidatus Trichorickettsia mobilis]